MSDTTQIRALRLAVLISGTGRTLRNLIQRIEADQLAGEVRLVIASTPNARGLQHAEIAAIPIEVIERKDFPSREAFSERIFEACRKQQVDLVILAGYIKLLVIPPDFENRVLNIHPSLIPAFCGEGFFGHPVHEAAIEYGVKISGCTVHFVDNEYDHGPVILQKAVPVLDTDTPDTLNDRVFDMECVAYPEAIQLIAEDRVRVEGRRIRVLPAPGAENTARPRTLRSLGGTVASELASPTIESEVPDEAEPEPDDIDNDDAEYDPNKW